MTLYQSFRRYLQNKEIVVEPGSEQGSLFIFRIDNLSYVFYYDNNYPHYFRLMLPYIANYDNVDANELNKRALRLSGEYKVGKLFVVDNQIWASFEQIILNPDADNSEIFETGIRILSFLFHSISEFVKSQNSDSST